jgi:TolB protein
VGSSVLRKETYSRVGEDFQVTIHPDGETMVFASTAYSKSPDLFYKKITSRQRKQLTFHPGSDLWPSFNPDGDLLVFTSNRGGDWDLYLISFPPRPDEKPMKLSPSDATKIHASWAPDGHRLVYSEYDEIVGEWRLKIIDIFGPEGRGGALASTETLIREDDLYGIFPEWCPRPRDERIVFQRARGRGSNLYGIWMINADGSGLTRVIDSTEHACINPSWHPTLDKIVYSTVSGERYAESMKASINVRSEEVWVISIDGTGETRITDRGQLEWGAVFSWPLGDRIFFTSEMPGETNIWSTPYSPTR